MKKHIKTWNLLALAVVMAILTAMPVMAQEKQADNMKIFAEKLKADKKLLVAENMKLTDTEAKAFWPVYDHYQLDLFSINHRIGELIKSYAKAYVSGTVTDEKAQQFISELVAIEILEGGLKAIYVPLLSKTLPPKKVVRYLQIESKIRAVIKLDLVSEIPLVR